MFIFKRYLKRTLSHTTFFNKKTDQLEFAANSSTKPDGPTVFLLCQSDRPGASKISFRFNISSWLPVGVGEALPCCANDVGLR
jgi:hypothetical protein